jgi:hypothetical protein
MNRLSGAGPALLLTAVLAACASGTAASPIPSPTPSQAAGGSGVALPSLGNSDKELEALIPNQAAGVTLQKFSMKGSEFATSANADAETLAFLSALGVSARDIGVAFGFGYSAEAKAAIAIFAFRAVGASPDRLVQQFKQATNRNRPTPLSWQSATVGGKSVQWAADASQQDVRLYLYGRGDVLFLVSATTESQAADALGKLP